MPGWITRAAHSTNVFFLTRIGMAMARLSTQLMLAMVAMVLLTALAVEFVTLRGLDEAVLSRARNAGLMAGFGAALVAGFVAVLIARSLTRPITQMTQAMQAFAQNGPMAPPVAARGEIGLLARAFGRMTTEMSEKTSELRRETEERRRIFETSLDLIIVVDRRGKLIRVSPSSIMTLGYAPDEMIGRSAADFLFTDDLERTRNEMRQLRRGRLMRNFETRYVHKDGRVVSLAWTGVWSEPEQQHFFIGRDVTEQKLAEELFRLAVEASPSGMMMIDRGGRIVMVNGELEHLFGYRREELMGQKVEMLVPGNMRAEHAQLRSEFIQRPESRSMGAGRELFGLRKDGSEFPLEIGLNPIHIRDGLLILGVVVDISERRRTERLKDEFVSTVSHELRTPLTSIAASLALLKAGGAGRLPEQAARLVTIAHNNGQRLVRLINDILDIEKIESGKIKFNFKQVEVRSTVEQAIDANRPYADDYGVRVRLDSESVAGDLRTDQDRLVQVITNLLSNAIKFSPRDEEVVVGITGRDGFIRITVRDHGPGIPDEFKPRVFDKFAQADASDARQKGGTGLGLSIVKQIVNRLGGEVGFESAVGHGTLFFVELPRWRPGIDTLPHAVRGNDVLLCEDDADAAEELRAKLATSGFTVHTATTVQEAIEQAENFTFAAVLVDLKLPDGDGVSLIQRLRTQPRYQETPIVVLSGNPGRGREDARSRTLEVLDWLDKPVDVARLTAALNNGLGRAMQVAGQEVA
ncbi:MAG TPA: PAS domain S-box protein [Pseudolabrys sp.]|nr:PAS domain S-box protein [Pseudolabrys sp.]